MDGDDDDDVVVNNNNNLGASARPKPGLPAGRRPPAAAAQAPACP